jgi:L-threonylcarbamoyladenylate synthase
MSNTLPQITDIPTLTRTLRQQNIGLIPADTLWGISGIACDGVAQRIQLIKNRHSPKPLILLIHNLAQLGDWITPLSETQQQLCNSHWPGPVTLLLPASTMAPHALTAGLPTLGVRMPATPHLKDLLIALDRPLISTSANLTGHPAPAQRQDIHPDILSLVAFQANWEDPPGTASLILDITQDPPRRVR